MRKQRPELLNLDILALSLLSCLLASVVGMLVLGGDGKAFKQRIALAKSTADLTGRVGQATAALDAITHKLQQSAFMRQNEVKLSELEEMQQNIKARLELKEAKEEVARLSVQWQKAEQERRESAPRNGIFGDYHGPYVLVECVRGRVEIFPSEQHFGLNPSREQVASLMEQITEAGFVLFVVRPSGWFQNSYDALYPMISKQLDQLEKTQGKVIGRAVLPLDEDTSLDAYLPRTRVSL